MSGVRAHLVTSALCGLSLFVPFNQSAALPSIKASFSSTAEQLTQTMHVTLRTQEGLERFVLSPQETSSPDSSETHFRGFARPRNYQRDRLPVAATFAQSKVWLFFTSRRTGRPVAATVTFDRDGARLTPRRTRISRVPAHKLACGSHAGEDDHAHTASQTVFGRRRGTSSRPRLSAQGVRSFSPPRILEVATEADAEFYQVHGEDTNSYIRAVLNAVDAIYTSNLGIRFQVTSQRVTKTRTGARGPVPAIRLLEEFRTSPFASSSPADVRHLFTGRSIDGLTIGIAYVGAACVSGGRYGVGLSAAVSTGLQPFLAAHEIAHNLSAAHDYEPQSIMNPAITAANNRLTSTSATSMYDFVSTAGTCISTDALSGVGVRVNSSSPAEFSARVSFVTRESQACGVLLYGSTDGRRFIPLVSQSVTSPGGGASTGTIFSASLPPTTGQQTLFLKARVSCGTSRALSNPYRAQFGATSSGSQNNRAATRWLDALKKNLNS